MYNANWSPGEHGTTLWRVTGPDGGVQKLESPAPAGMRGGTTAIAFVHGQSKRIGLAYGTTEGYLVLWKEVSDNVVSPVSD